MPREKKALVFEISLEISYLDDSRAKPIPSMAARISYEPLSE
jgi:hypothetical protein